MSSLPHGRRALSLLAGLGLLMAALPAAAQDPAPLATVNGTAITEADLGIIAADLAGSLPQGTPAQMKQYLTEFAIDLDLAAAEAQKQNLVGEADLAKRLDYFRRKVLMEALLTKVTQEAVTDAAAQALYDETKAKTPPQEEVRARHILVETEDQAKAARERVAGKGEDFATVAKELSKDPGSSDGGDLGYFTRDRMVKEFADAAFALQPGEISQPVKSQFGWHVIKVEDRRQQAFPPFEQLKPQIDQFLARKAQQDLIVKLRADAKIELATPPTPPAAAAPAPAAPAEAPKQP